MAGVWIYLGIASLVFVLGIVAGRSVGVRGAESKSNRRDELDNEDVLGAFRQVVEGDLAGAYDMLSKRARSRDARPQVYFALAALTRALGHTDRSAQIHRTILARPNLDRELADRARIGLARDLVEVGQGKEAREILDSLPKKSRGQVSLLGLRSQAAIQSGDWDEAINVSNALAKATGDGEDQKAELLAQIAEMASAQGDVDAASKGFRRALRIRPGTIRARQGLARLYLEDGRASKARRHLMAALEANPALAPVLLPQIRDTLHNEKGDDSRFEELLESLEREPGVGLWAKLERVDRLYQQAEIAGANSLLQELLKRYPRSVEVHEAYLNLLIETEDGEALTAEIARFIDLAAEEIRRFRCAACGYVAASPFMECPNCAEIGALAYDGG